MMPITLEQTKDGHPAVSVRHLTFAFLPSRCGTQMAVRSLYPSRKPADCVASDFTNQYEVVADITGFTASVQTFADHHAEVDQLNRVELRGPLSTMWGGAQTRTQYAPGIESVTTASHGGFILDHEQNAHVDPEWRNTGGNYEEDSAWSIVAFTFPQLFTKYERELAEKELIHWHPDTWERLTGKTIPEGASHTRNEQAFATANVANFVVISALRSRTHTGQVECIATVGGVRSHSVPRVNFLVPSDEYAPGRHGFVIDEARHPRLDANNQPLPLPA